MRPFFRQTKPALVRSKIAALSLISALCLCACGNDDKSTPSAEFEASGTIAELHLEYGNIPLLDSIVLDAYGIDTLHIMQNSAETDFSLDLFPYDRWKFEAKLYANGFLMQTGELTARIDAGEIENFFIQMHPLLGFFYVEIPLGLGNPVGIQEGVLELVNGKNSYSYTGHIQNDAITFASEALPLNQDYQIKLILKNKTGEELYHVEDNVTLSEDEPVPNLNLMALRGKANLSVQIAEQMNFNIKILLPSGRRAPRNGDMLITEFFSSPLKSDSSQYEFIEIYNGSLDTLNLAGCTIGTTANEAKGWKITRNFIAPSEILVLGDSSAKTPEPFRNTETWGDLTNTQSNIVLACDGIAMDSLYYNSKPDSLSEGTLPNYSNPSSNPLSTALDMAKWEAKDKATSWCMGTPTPGSIQPCP
ncbi:MAG: lamin tail domain-containing protein [Fibrobacter sp.]|nr:lamin tail domain-containing protein [Fibrobacter sp.]